MAKSNLISLKQILGNDLPTYIEQEVIPALRTGVEEGRITRFELQKITDLIDREGIGSFDTLVRVRGDASSNNVESNGQLLEIVTNLPGDSSVKNFVKMFSVEDLPRAVSTQRSLHDIVSEESRFQSSIPEVRYVNRRRRILTTPFVEGRTLKDELGDRDEVGKVELLKRVIDEYVNLFNFLEERKERIDAPQGFRREYTEFFKDLFCDGKKDSTNYRLIELYQIYVGSLLQKRSNRFVHGDLNIDGVIVNGGISFVDWSRSHKSGFLEYDVGQLLRKVPLSQEAEDRVVRFAAEKINPKDVESSIKLYHMNRVNEDLIAAKRYMNRAKKEEERGLFARVREFSRTKRESKAEEIEKLRRHATYLYNSAMNRFVRREDDLESLELVIQLDRNAGFRRVSEEQYLELEREYFAEDKTSIEYIQDTKVRSPEVNLKRIERKVRQEQRRPLIRRSALVLGLVGLTLGGIVSTKMYSNSLVEKAKDETREQKIAAYQKEKDFERYESIFKYSFNRLQEGVITNAGTPKEVKQYSMFDPIVDQVATEYGLDVNLLRNILMVNRVFSGIGSQDSVDFKLAGPSRNGINVFDPLFYDHRVPLDPEINLRSGAQRLKKLIDTNKDLRTALKEFYTPTKGTPNFCEERSLLAIDGFLQALALSAEKGCDSCSEFGGQLRVYSLKEPEGVDIYQFFGEIYNKN